MGIPMTPGISGNSLDFESSWTERTVRFRIGDNLILDVPRNFAADYQNTTHFSLARKLSQDEDRNWTQTSKNKQTAKNW